MMIDNSLNINECVNIQIVCNKEWEEQSLSAYVLKKCTAYKTGSWSRKPMNE